MTEPPSPTSPDTPEIPKQVTVDIQQLAKMMAEEAVKAAQDTVATMGLYKTRGEVVAKDADEHVQIRRETALNDDGSAGDPDPGFYPVPSPGTLPQIGDTVWCIGNNGGLVVLGKEAAAGYQDILDALSEPPVGSGAPWYGTSDPPGGKWMVCDGRVLIRADYPDLFAIIGTIWNTGGETSTQFRIPDTRGRVGVGAGQGTNLSNRLVAAQFGFETHTLITSEMPIHTHTTTVGTPGDHTHSGSTGSSSHSHSGKYSEAFNYGAGSAHDAVYNIDSSSGTDTFSTASDSHSHGFTTGGSGDHSHTVTLGNAGSGTAHDNMQPSLARNEIIRVLL